MTEPKKHTHQADIDKIAAMANAARRRILDILTIDGPATVGKLAERTGERVGSVSHHLKVLAQAGLIEEAPELAKDRRESWWRPVPVTWGWSITEFADDPAGQIIAQAAEQETLRSNIDKVQTYYATREEFSDAWVEAAHSATSMFKATPEELLELTQRMSDLVGEFTSVDRKDDGKERLPVLMFTYAMPVRP